MDQVEAQLQGIRPYHDEHGRNYRTYGDEYNPRDWGLHICAKALAQTAEHYSDPVPNGQQHPLEYLASLTRVIADNRLSLELAETFGVFVSYSWRLDGEQLLLLVKWTEELAKAIQERK